ncbi:MAG: sigma-54 dependent transcriptional regulator [Puniceicoccaceae bacterium]
MADVPSYSVLIADDQEDILKALRMLLRSEGFRISVATHPDEVVDQVRRQEFDVVLLDLNYTRDTTSGQEGLELVRTLRGMDADLSVVVMTAWASVELAVEIMREGARDFITKPWENERVVSVMRNQAEYTRLVRKGKLLREENKILRSDQKVEFISRSEAMKPVLEIIDAVGPSDANVLITGENGTGKGVIAKVLHERSHRREKPFISVNMGGLPEGIFESELFGHVKGAFTDARADRAGRFELADEGALFMDEIGNVPLNQQNKLLRLLETGEFERVGSSKTRKVDVRIISATNADMDEAVRSGAFRQDLLYRLNTIHIHLPPLRERIEDIDVLADHFLNRHLQKYRKPIEGFSSKAIELLKGYEWPGNVRELDHCVERSVLMCKDSLIEPTHLGLNGSTGGVQASMDDMSLDDLERYFIERTLKRHGGNATEAAKALGLSRSAFYRRLQRFGL